MASNATTPSNMIEAISAFKGVDRALNKVPAPVPVLHSGEADASAGPAQYRSNKQPTVTERADLAKMLGTTPQIQVPVTQEDVDRAQEKAWLSVLWDFDKWVVKAYLNELDGPAKKDWLKRHYPELFERMDDAIKALNNAKAKYEKLKIGTIDNLGDMWFMYTFERDSPFIENHIQAMMMDILGIQTGKVPGYVDTHTAFQRGVWNLRRRFNTYAGIAALPLKRVPDWDENYRSASNYDEYERRRTLPVDVVSENDRLMHVTGKRHVAGPVMRTSMHAGKRFQNMHDYPYNKKYPDAPAPMEEEEARRVD